MIPGAERLRSTLEARRRLPWELRYRYGASLASWARQRIIRATHLHCRVEFGDGVLVGPDFSLDIPDAGTLIIGDGVEFRRGFHCEISGDGRVSIGAESVFTASGLIQCTTSIVIGQRVMFGQSTMIADGNHRFRDHNLPLAEQGYDFRPISIGDDATIMTKCTIVNDIGTHAVIAANSVVTKPIPPYCIAGGAPARILDYFGPAELRPVELSP